MQLNSLFDVLRGWPKEGAIDSTFAVGQTSPPTFDSIVPGMVVKVGTDGSVTAATTPNRSSTAPLPVWVVVEGNDDFSGTFLEKAVCLRANAVFKLDPSNFNAGSYTPGTRLTFSSGKWQPAATNDQIIGEVLADDTATDGTVTVYYSGGDAAMA